MNKKTTGIIITIVVTLICACLPLCVGLVGLVDWMGQQNFLGLSDDNVMYLGFGGICLGFLGIIVAVVVGILTLRKKPEDSFPTDEPLPPAY